MKFTLGKHWLLVSELFQHLGGSGQTITRLTNTVVDDELVNFQLSHGIGLLIFSHFNNLSIQSPDYNIYN